MFTLKTTFMIIFIFLYWHFTCSRLIQVDQLIILLVKIFKAWPNLTFKYSYSDHANITLDSSFHLNSFWVFHSFHEIKIFGLSFTFSLKNIFKFRDLWIYLMGWTKVSVWSNWRYVQAIQIFTEEWCLVLLLRFHKKFCKCWRFLKSFCQINILLLWPWNWKVGSTLPGTKH